MIDTKKAFELETSNFIDLSEGPTGVYPEEFSVLWTPSTSLPYFEGHFPENPILPAVAIIDATLSFLSQKLDHPNLEISELVNCKFTGIIQPGNDLVIRFTLKQTGDSHLECQATWSFSKELEKKVVSLQISLKV